MVSRSRFGEGRHAGSGSATLVEMQGRGYEWAWLVLAAAVAPLACGGDTSDGGTATGGSAGSSTGGGAGSAGSATGGTGGGGDVCQLPQDSGPCDAAMRRWWFNAATGKCEPFVYGGCQGNANNFQTAMDCVGACAPAVANACEVIACPPSSVCAFTAPDSATCATPCGAGETCPAGQTCGCGASCAGCKDCIQICTGD